MAKQAGDFSSYPERSYRGDRVTSVAKVAIGATGAPTLTSDNAGITITRNTTGVYDITFPPCQRCAILPVLKSAASTVVNAYFAAKDDGAGTAQLITHAGGSSSPVDPANADELQLVFFFDTNPNA